MKRLIYLSSMKGKTPEQIAREMMENSKIYKAERPDKQEEYKTKLTEKEIQRIMKQSGLTREVIEYEQARKLND